MPGSEESTVRDLGPDFCEVAEEIYMELLKHAKRATDSLADAEDLAADSLLKAWYSWRSYENRGDAKLEA